MVISFLIFCLQKYSKQIRTWNFIFFTLECKHLCEYGPPHIQPAVSCLRVQAREKQRELSLIVFTVAIERAFQFEQGLNKVTDEKSLAGPNFTPDGE